MRYSHEMPEILLGHTSLGISSFMRKLFFLLFAAQWLIFEHYIYLNVATPGEEGQAPGLIVLCIAIGMLLSAWTILDSKSTAIRGSFFIIIPYIFYYALRCTIDLDVESWLRPRFLGTDNGILLFYLLGLILALPLQRALALSNASPIDATFFKWMVGLMIVLSVIDTLSIVSLYHSLLRTDIFLIADSDGAYQRPGDLLSIRMFALSAIFLVLRACVKSSNTTFGYLRRTLTTTAFLIQLPMCMYVAQALGSNKGTVLIGAIFIITIFLLLALGVRKQQTSLHIRTPTIFNLVFHKISRRALAKLVLLSIVLIFIGIQIAPTLGIELRMFRIFGFGSGELSSVDSRIALIKENFMTHFLYAPFFGNANVEILTTGEGTYIHSILGYALTHTGIFGLLLMLWFLYAGLKERVRPNIILEEKIPDNSSDSLNFISLHMLICALTVVFLGIASNSIIWSVLWFSFGFHLLPVTLTIHKKGTQKNRT